MSVCVCVCVCVLPAVAGPGLGGSPAVGVCVCCAAVQGGGVDVREETLRSEELLMRRRIVYWQSVKQSVSLLSYFIMF